MKKSFIYLFLLAIIPVLGFSSCSDEDNIPDVHFELDITGGVSVDGIIYVVQGDAFTINGIEVTNLENKDEAFITSATYYWDTDRVGIATIPPYGMTIETTENTRLGRHNLAIECPLYIVDHSPAMANLFYLVEVVAAPEDIPSGDTPATQNFEARSHILR